MKMEILSGLKFAAHHELTKREIEILLLFMEQDMTMDEAAKALNSLKTSLYNTLLRLKIKGLIEMKDKKEKGVVVYGFKMPSSQGELTS
jgi:predicted transcriptional regulator